MSPAVVTPFVYGTLVVFLSFLFCCSFPHAQERERDPFSGIREFFSRKTTTSLLSVKKKQRKKEEESWEIPADLTYFHLKSLVLYSWSADPRQSTVKVRCWDKTLGEREKKRTKKQNKRWRWTRNLRQPFWLFLPGSLKPSKKRGRNVLLISTVNC